MVWGRHRPRVTREMGLLQGSSLHRRGPPGAVKALPGPGAQRLAQRLAQSRCSEALWGEWKPGWKSKASQEAGVGTVIRGERA